jgi:hypothetical protein
VGNESFFCNAVSFYVLSLARTPGMRDIFIIDGCI